MTNNYVFKSRVSQTRNLRTVYVYSLITWQILPLVQGMDSACKIAAWQSFSGGAKWKISFVFIIIFVFPHRINLGIV